MAPESEAQSVCFKGIGNQPRWIHCNKHCRSVGREVNEEEA